MKPSRTRRIPSSTGMEEKRRRLSKMRTTWADEAAETRPRRRPKRITRPKLFWSFQRQAVSMLAVAARKRPRTVTKVAAIAPALLQCRRWHDRRASGGPDGARC